MSPIARWLPKSRPHPNLSEPGNEILFGKKRLCRWNDLGWLSIHGRGPYLRRSEEGQMRHAKWRQRRERCGHEPRITGSHWEPPGAGRDKRILAKGLWRKLSPGKPLDFGPVASRTTFCCFQPPGLWHFVLVAPGSGYRYWINSSSSLGSDDTALPSLDSAVFPRFLNPAPVLASQWLPTCDSHSNE